MSEITITKENFNDEVINCDKTVLVDFWADWCGPCKMLAPTISEIAEEFADSVKVGKVNVDEQPELADKFSITSIPTVIAFKDGKVLDTSVGYVSKSKLEAMII